MSLQKRLQNMKRSEDTEQMRVIAWRNASLQRYPMLRWLHHIPNEGERKNGGKAKEMGLTKGISDLHLPYPKGCYIGLYIEMKFGDNIPSKEQTEFLKDMESVGHYTCICYSAEAAIEVITKYVELYDRQVLMTDALECRSAKRNRNGIPVIY